MARRKILKVIGVRMYENEVALSDKIDKLFSSIGHDKTEVCKLLLEWLADMPVGEAAEFVTDLKTGGAASRVKLRQAQWKQAVEEGNTEMLIHLSEKYLDKDGT